jgi:hypothetical protein
MCIREERRRPNITTDVDAFLKNGDRVMIAAGSKNRWFQKSLDRSPDGWYTL